MGNQSLKDYDIASLSIDARLKRIKSLQEQILSDAQTHGFLKQVFYFGHQREVVDEARFPNEILELKSLLQSLSFSNALHNKFEAARKKLTETCMATDSDLKESIGKLKNLSIEEQLDLARRIISEFHKVFFGSNYRYAEPELEFDPESNRSFTRNFAYKTDQDHPRSSMVQLSNNVMGTGNIGVFLNLVFHEGCVHAVMYQLEQSYACGWMKSSDPLYQDAKQRRVVKENKISAPFQIPSIYPNYLEEAIAFKQAAEFVAALGYKPLGMEDEIVLTADNNHWPYNHDLALKSETPATKQKAKEQWHILREDFNANVFVMSARPFDTEEKAKEVLTDFLSKQRKPHHQDYTITNQVPQSARWDLATLNVK